MSDFSLSLPPILAAILCNASLLVFQPPTPPPYNYCTVPKDSALAAKFQKPSYGAKESNLVSSFPFTKEGFVRLKSIRISLLARLAVGSFPKCMKPAN